MSAGRIFAESPSRPGSWCLPAWGRSILACLLVLFVGACGSGGGSTSTTYTIQASAGANGTLNPSGSAQVNRGADKTFEIRPNPGYAVDSVLVDGANQGAITTFTFTNVQLNHTISATFKVITYTLQASAGSNGSVSPSGSLTVNAGSSQTFTFTPATGYQVDKVMVDGALQASASSYTFTDIQANHTLSVTFKPLTFTISASAGANGSISPAGDTVLNFGASQAFTVTPNVGYIVDTITVDGVAVGSGTGYTFSNVSANHTISVTFKILTFTIQASAGSHGTISPTGTVTLNYGSDQTYTAVPDAGYVVDTITVDGTAQTPASSYAFHSVRANHVIAMTFKPGLTLFLTAGSSSQVTLNTGNGSSLTFTFPAGCVSQDSTVYLAALNGPPIPLPNPAPVVNPGNAWLLGFTLVLSPSGIPFNTAPQITGVVPSGIPSGTNTLNMATLRNNAWGDVGSFLVGSGGAITETLPSVLYPGVQTTGTYGVYVPVTPIASNYGIALIADDGNGFGPSAHALQVVTLFDALGHPLTTPTIKYLSFPNAYDLDGQALTPDGSQGILVDGGNTVRFFSQVQTGNPVASATTVDISQFGGDGDAVAIMPDGNEAVVSGDDSSKLVLISGISSGTPQLAAPIGIPGSRDGLVLSNDGKVMLARGGSSITVFQITPITPVTGSLGGKVYHSFANTGEISNAPGSTGEDGRNGMAFSPVDSSRAVVVGSGTIALIQGLPDNPTLRSSSISGGAVPYAVSISFDGKLAVVGTDKGLALYAGVDTGLLTPVGPLFAPSFQSGGTSYFLGDVKTLGITLDGKHVVACSQVPSSQNGTLLVIPFSRSGFQAPVGQLDGVAVPDNDQLVMH